MVHTMVTIMYALNVLSRYSNNPGPRHIQYIKHLVRFVKYSKKIGSYSALVMQTEILRLWGVSRYPYKESVFSIVSRYPYKESVYNIVLD
jgi:hypothetical protein